MFQPNLTKTPYVECAVLLACQLQQRTTWIILVPCFLWCPEQRSSNHLCMLMLLWFVRATTGAASWGSVVPPTELFSDTLFQSIPNMCLESWSSHDTPCQSCVWTGSFSTKCHSFNRHNMVHPRDMASVIPSEKPHPPSSPK